MVLKFPQSGQRPNHFGVVKPQAEHTYCVVGAFAFGDIEILLIACILASVVVYCVGSCSLAAT